MRHCQGEKSFILIKLKKNNYRKTIVNLELRKTE